MTLKLCDRFIWMNFWITNQIQFSIEWKCHIRFANIIKMRSVDFIIVRNNRQMMIHIGTNRKPNLQIERDGFDLFFNLIYLHYDELIFNVLNVHMLHSACCEVSTRDHRRRHNDEHSNQFKLN